MLTNVYWACGFVLACILFYRFAIPALRRFDQENVQRIARQEHDKSDPEAHFRHALDVANEQVEAVQEIRTGTAMQYLFETQIYFSRDEAEEARAHVAFVGLEAMAFGCPVACSDAGSISEVVGDAGAYFQPDDVQGLRAILERLAEDRAYAAELRAKGFAQIKKYSWESCARETLHLYEQLLGVVPSLSRSTDQ